MFAIRFTTALTAAVLLFCPASAAVSDRGHEPTVQPPPATSTDEPTGSVTIARGSGADLIRMVEKKLPGVRVFDLNLTDEGSVPWFEVKSYKGDQVWSTMIDVATRRIVRSSEAKPASVLDAETLRDLGDFRRIKMKLSEAVVIAEQLSGGRAISAGLHRGDNKLVFVVVVVADGALKEVTVEPDK